MSNLHGEALTLALIALAQLAACFKFTNWRRNLGAFMFCFNVGLVAYLVAL